MNLTTSCNDFLHCPQLCLVEGQFSYRRIRRRSNPVRRSATTSSPSTYIPAFLARAFGFGSSDDDENQGKSLSEQPATPLVAATRSVYSPMMASTNRRISYIARPIGVMPKYPNPRRYVGASSFPRRQVATFAGPNPGTMVAKRRRRIPTQTVKVKTLPTLAVVQKAVKPVNVPDTLEGWVSYPTPAPVVTTSKPTPTNSS